MSASGAPACDDNAIVGIESGQELVGRLQRAACDRHVPLNAMIELTLTCNIRCLHCYNFDRDAPRDRGCDDAKPELSLAETLNVLGDLRAAGCLFLGLTGGEVLSSPKLFPVLDRARELNMAVQLLSNGTLLRPGVASRLAGYRNLLGASVSLYGATPEVHDGITQVRGSWRRTWDGIERLRALGIAVRLKFVVMRQNAHEVAAMLADAAARRMTYVLDATITARYDGSRTSLATRVDDDQLRALYHGPLRDLVPKHERKVSEYSFACNCARGNCAISATGDVTPCVSVPWVAGNIRERSFIDIWRYAPVFQRIRGLRMADYPACGPCPDKGYCVRDRGAALTVSGSYTGVDPFVCRTAALRREIAEEGARAPSAGHEARQAPEELATAAQNR
jgi:radical SAM protein with 4Fe4S-binding SPASM domain